jgi:hypothetical protein
MHCSHITLNFNWVFQKNNSPAEILSRNTRIFISLFINEMRGGAASANTYVMLPHNIQI